MSRYVPPQERVLLGADACPDVRVLPAIGSTDAECGLSRAGSLSLANLRSAPTENQGPRCPPSPIDRWIQAKVDGRHEVAARNKGG